MEASTTDPDKGDFHWPETTVGRRMYIRCPYSTRTPVYAYRECVLDPMVDDEGVVVTKHLYMQWNATWEAANITMCPVPPMGQLLKRLNKELGPVLNCATHT